MKQTTLEKRIAEIKASGIALPAPAFRLLRFRGVGPDTLRFLDDLGFVEHGGNEPIDELSVRAGNTLYNLGLTTKEQVREAILAGTLQKRRNYGPSTHTEVCKWAGIPSPKPAPKKQKWCPHCGKPL